MLMILAVFMAGCGSKSSSEIIIGKWNQEDNATSGWEFFSDGSMIAFYGDDTDEAKWSISEDSLKVSNPYGDETLLFDIRELTEDRLVLSTEGVDQELVFVKE